MKSRWIALLLLTPACSPTDGKAKVQEYEVAKPGYIFEFPRDYFDHEAYRTEWWYYTGNVKAADGHRFGYELTFFRQGISRAERTGPWFIDNLWMAHMALSDINGQRFYCEQRLNRAGPGIAGVNAQTGRVWNGNWQANIADNREAVSGITDKFSLAISIQSMKPPVIQGQDGISRKAEGAGHASHYFSLTRLLTTGSVELDGKTYQVEGTSWFDHEFFTGSMARNETGWDWLSIQLENGCEVMLYRLRHTDGSVDPYSSGSYVDATGRSQFLSAQDFVMRPGPSTSGAQKWTSPTTKATYPVQWHVSIARLKLELDVTTPLESQEITGGFGPDYWEGAIDVSGTQDNSALRGVGYLEMTGYTAGGQPVILQ